MSSPRRFLPPVLLWWATAVLLSSWAFTLLAGGRSLPWQVTRNWILIFVVAALLVAAWWWPVLSMVNRNLGPHRSGQRVLPLAFGPAVAIPLLLVFGAYVSDQLYAMLVNPDRRPLTLVATVLIMVASASWARVAIGRSILDTSPWSSVPTPVVLSETRRVALVALCAVGLLQAMAMSTPIGDDIGKYTEAALAILDRQPYPVHQAGADLVAAGMSPNSPALPGLSVLLAGSFAVFGRDFAGLAIMLGAISVLFPIAMYSATLCFTRNRLAAFAASALMTLFPAYQIHILGTAVPDTLFVVTLLFAASAIAQAIQSDRLRWWVLAGIAVALFANTRPEGLNFSLAALGWLGLFHFRTRQYWALVIAYLAAMFPFSVTYMSVAGSPWPTTFSGTVGAEHFQTNLTYLRDLTLPWYEQAIGVPAAGLAAIGIVLVLAAFYALFVLLRERPGLAFVPLLGYGYIFASLFIHPLILMSYTPVDVLRHWSSGVPYIALTLAFAIHGIIRGIRERLPVAARQAVLLFAVTIVTIGIYYECDRLAKPEWYFGGSTSLLWTGGSYLLTDVIRDPIPLPVRGDPRTGEEMRKEQSERLAPYNLRHSNLGEPYHWATLMVALFGLLYLSVPPAVRLAARSQGLPVKSGTQFQILD